MAKCYCMVCGNTSNSTKAVKVESHNDYCFICPDCYESGSIKTTGCFIPKSFIERQAKKSAGHGCITSFEVITKESETDLRSYLLTNYETVRIGKLIVSNGKVGTWQVSKVADYIGKDRIKVHFTKRQNGKTYTLTADPDTIIELVRNISSIGYLTNKAIEKYGIKEA